MPTKNATFAKQPTYRLRPDYGQAIVTLTDAVTRKRRDYWLGEYDSPESHEMYRRLLACWEERGRRLFDPNDVPRAATNSTTITEIIFAYKQFVDVTYKVRRDKPSIWRCAFCGSISVRRPQPNFDWCTCHVWKFEFV